MAYQHSLGSRKIENLNALTLSEIVGGDFLRVVSDPTVIVVDDDAARHQLGPEVFNRRKFGVGGIEVKWTEMPRDRPQPGPAYAESRHAPFSHLDRAERRAHF